MSADASGGAVSACAQLCNAIATCAQAEQRAVELAHERRTVAVHQHRDEQPSHELGRRRVEALDEVGALLRRLAEQRSRAHARGVQPLAVAERRVESLLQLLAAERVVLEERELPAVERVSERDVVVGERELGGSFSATDARNGSSRVGSPGGAVAAIGSTGRMP